MIHEDRNNGLNMRGIEWVCSKMDDETRGGTVNEDRNNELDMRGRGNA